MESSSGQDHATTRDRQYKNPALGSGLSSPNLPEGHSTAAHGETPDTNEIFLSPAQILKAAQDRYSREQKKSDIEFFMSPAQILKLAQEKDSAVDEFFLSPAQILKLAQDRYDDEQKKSDADIIFASPVQVLKEVLGRRHSQQETFAAGEDGLPSSSHLLGGHVRYGVEQGNSAVDNVFLSQVQSLKKAQDSCGSQQKTYAANGYPSSSSTCFLDGNSSYEGEQTNAVAGDDIPVLALDYTRQSNPNPQQPPTPVLRPIMEIARQPRLEKNGCVSLEKLGSFTGGSQQRPHIPRETKPVMPTKSTSHEPPPDNKKPQNADRDDEVERPYHLKPPLELSYLEKNWTSRQVAEKLQDAIDRLWERLPDVYDLFTGLDGDTVETDEAGLPEAIEDVLREAKNFRLWIKENKLRAKEHPEIRGIVHGLESWVLDNLKTLNKTEKHIAAQNGSKPDLDGPNLEQMHMLLMPWAKEAFARGVRLIVRMEYFTQGAEHIPCGGLQMIEEVPKLEEKERADEGETSDSSDTSQWPPASFVDLYQN